MQSQVDNTKYRHKQGVKCFELVHSRSFKKWDVLWESTQKQGMQTSQNTQFMVEMDLHNFPLRDEKATWNCAWDLFLIRFFSQRRKATWTVEVNLAWFSTTYRDSKSCSPQHYEQQAETWETKRKVIITKAKQASALALLYHWLWQASQTFLKLWMTN